MIIDKTIAEQGYFLALKNGTAVLADGYYIEDDKLYFVEPPSSNATWNFNTKTWADNRTQEEIIDEYNKLIDTLKAELLEDGFIYPDKKKTSHQQKCRDKDLSYLGNAIASMEDANIPKMKWYFNNGDMVELILEEMKGLRTSGAVFLSTVFGVEAQLKAEQPTKNLTLTMFKDKVDAVSAIKCYRDK